MTTNVGAGVNTFYDKKFLKRVNKKLALIPFGQKRPLPEGSGTSIEFFRWLNLAVSVSGATLTQGQHPDATTFKGQKLTATLAEYGAWLQISSLLKQSHIDRNVSGAVDILAEHAANVLDTKCHMEVCSNGLYPVRADLDATAEYSGTITTATSTTSNADSALETNTDYGDANDDLNQSVMIITSGTGYGQARTVSDYVASGGVITTPAFDVAPAVGDTFIVVTPDGITTGDDLSYENIKRARTILKKNLAVPVEGKYYVCLIDPDAAEDLMDDTKWIAAHTYKDSMETGLFDGEIGRFAGVRFVEENNSFKFPINTRGTAGTSYGPGAAGANYAATGAVTTNIMLGKDCFGVTTFANKSGQAAKPNIIVKTPGNSDTNQPLNRWSSVGWVVEAVYKSLNPLFGVGIWTKS